MAISPEKPGLISESHFRYQPGDKIGQQFTVLHRTRGGFGEVYFTIKSDGLPVVLKTPRIKILPWAQKSLIEEAKKWTKISGHPNIVQCYRYETIDGLPFLELEWVFSQHNLFHNSLRDILGVPLELRTAIEFSLQILWGLSHIQSVMPGFIHQDIKPSNILIAQNTIKITDFGLARVKKEDGRFGGTLPYMAPEQFDHDSLFDMRVDIYAFGLILFEMVTGYFPYQVATDLYRTKDRSRLVKAWEYQHKFQKHAPIPEHIPPFVSYVVEKCLKKEPDARFSSYDDIIKILEEGYHSLFGQSPIDVLTPESTLPDWLSHYWTGISFENLGQQEESLHLYNEVIMENPSFADAYIRKGSLLAQMVSTSPSYLQEAFDSLEKGLSLDPHNVLGYIAKARLYEYIGENEMAVNEYQRAIEFSTTITDVHYVYEKLGIFFRKHKRYKESLRAFEMAVTANPNCYFSMKELGYVYRMLGDFEKAAEVFTQILNYRGLDPFVLSERGECYRVLKQYQNAIDDFNTALDIDSRDVFALAHRGATYRDIGEHIQALTDLTNAIRIDKKFSWAYAERGLLYKKLGKNELAFRDYMTAIELNPTDSWTYFALGELLADTGERFEEALFYMSCAKLLSNPNDKIEEYDNLSEVIETWQNGLIDKAIRLLQSKYEEGHINLEALMDLLAVLYLNLDDDPTKTLYLGNLLFSVNVVEPAVRLYKVGLVECRNNELVKKFIANFMNSIPHLDDKRKIMLLDVLCELTSNNAIVFYSRGQFHYEHGNMQKSNSDFKRAIQINPELLSAYVELGANYREMKKYKEAISVYNEAIEKFPDKAVLFNNRGNCFHDLGLYKRAIEDRTIAINLDETYFRAYFNRGNSFLAIEEYEKAVNDYLECIKHKPTFTNAYYMLSLILIFMGKQEDAENLLKHLIDQNLSDKDTIRTQVLSRIPDEKQRNDLIKRVLES